MKKNKITPQLFPPAALEICNTLHQAGYQSYMVGGCVRDILLGIIPKDFDITTDATPQKIMELFPKNHPTGLQHGTITIVMGEGKSNHFEVTTFRIEGEYKDGRRPEEVFFVMDVKQDLARRDLTINAMAYDPIDDIIVDPYNGQLDLQNKIIRAVGNPNTRFQEDGLRIMRTARFAARFNYLVEKETFKAMQNNLDTLKKVSKERIQDELSKILTSIHASYGLQLLYQSGALEITCPLLTIGEDRLRYLFDVDKCEGELTTRLALLYACHKVPLVLQELTNLKLSNKDIKKVCFLLELLDRYQVLSSKDTVNAYKSFMATLKNHSPEQWQETLKQFIILTEAMDNRSYNLFLKYKDEIVLTKNEMKINGNDVLTLGFTPGPKIKEILDICYLRILKYPEENDNNKLLTYLKTFVNQTI